MNVETSTIRMVPLAMLRLSEINPRQTEAESDVEALALSIRTVGLLQNLVGLDEGGGVISIVGGGRRLRALRKLAEEGYDQPIPVIVTEDPAEARLWAGTENAVRKALNPADEIRAYGEMAKAAASPEMIAKAFGVSARHVKGRLKLAKAAPEVLDALRDGKITLEAAGAFALSDDQALQAAVLKRLPQYGLDSPSTIRRNLMPASEVGNKSVKFIGREAYEAAGGAVVEDLFGDEIYFTDVDLLNRLVEEKLAATAQAALADGWKWAEVGAADQRNDMTRIYPPIDEKSGDPVWTAEQRSVSGVVVTLGWDGSAALAEGLIKAEDHAEAIEKGVLAPALAVQKEEPPLYSIALNDDLRLIRTAAFQAAILRNPEVARDLLAFAISSGEFGFPANIRATDVDNRPGAGEISIPAVLTETHDTPPAGGMVERFKAFCERPAAEKEEALTLAVARSFAARLSLPGRQDPLMDLIGERVGAAPREIWTPDEAFFKRLSKERLLEIEQELLGSKGKKDGGASKADLVKTLSSLFAEPDRYGLTAKQRAKVLAWKPEGL